MTVLFRSSATALNDTSSPATVGAPSGLTSGDMLLLHVHCTDDVTPGVPSGFSLVNSVSGANGIYVYAKTATGSEPSTYDVTFTSGTASVGLSAYRSTAGKAISVDTSANQTNGSGDRLWPSVTATRSDFLLACFASVASNVGSTPHSGMSERYDAGTTRIYLMTETIVLAGATGTRTATGTAATSKVVSVVLAETPQPLRLIGTSTATQTNPSTSITVNVPADVQDGDFMLLQFTHQSDISITPPSGWDLVTNTTNQRIYKRVASSEPANYTFSYSSSRTGAGIIAWRSSTAQPVVVDASATHNNSEATTSHICPSVTTTRLDAILHCFLRLSSTNAITPDTDQDERWDIQYTGARFFLSTETVVSAGATGTRTLTHASPEQTSTTITVAIAEDVPTGPDAPPSDLVATAVNHGRIDLEWVDNSSNEDGFSIERSPNGTDSWVEIDTVAANETTYSDTGLTEYTNYWYRVRAFTTGPTYSDYSNTATDQTLLAAPSGLTATANGDIQIDLEWTINSAVPPDGTAIERSPNGSTGWTEIATVAHPTNTYGNSGLNPETTYWFRVRSYKVEA